MNKAGTKKPAKYPRKPPVRARSEVEAELRAEISRQREVIRGLTEQIANAAKRVTSPSPVATLHAAPPANDDGRDSCLLDYLQDHMLHVDISYGQLEENVLVIRWPQSRFVPGDLRETTTNAMAWVDPA